MERHSSSSSERPSTTPHMKVPSDWTPLRYESSRGVSPDRVADEVPLELADIQGFQRYPKLIEIVTWSIQPVAPAVNYEPAVHEPSREPMLSQPCQDPETPATTTFKPASQIASVVPDGTSQNNTTIERKISRPRKLKHDVLPCAEEPDARKEKLSQFSHSKSKSGESPKQEKQKPIVGECTSCFDEFPATDLISLDCTHTYCRACLKTLIMTALQNESAFPPKCCLSEIPLRTILVPLDHAERETYKQKAAEYSIPANARWYCPYTKCLKWIPPGKICSACRGVAHEDNVDCPQDFGMAAVLDVAEAEGWRRCFRCRAMVELTTGCRHISCKCGGEFCYVCGLKWKTCSCTESDQVNRQAALRRQRTERDEAALAEAEEVAAAIAEIEALERREAEERRQLEIQLELERQREEEQLARLEEIRLQEQAKLRLEQEEAEQQLQMILRLSLEEETKMLAQALQELICVQHAALDGRQRQEQHRLIQNFRQGRQLQVKWAEDYLNSMRSNIDKRIKNLEAKHLVEIDSLVATQEEQEDDLFLQIQLHLRGKPNNEARQARLQHSLKKQQEEDRQELLRKQKVALESLQQNAKMELEGLQRCTESKRLITRSEHSQKISEFCLMAQTQRVWFEAVCQRRIKMLQEHSRLILEDFDAGREPVGLTEEVARRISFLLPPAHSNQTLDTDQIEAPAALVELESITLSEKGKQIQADQKEPTTPDNKNTGEFLLTASSQVTRPETSSVSDSSQTSVISLGSGQEIIINAWTWLTGTRHDTHENFDSPPLPTMNPLRTTGVEHLLVKNGESNSHLVQHGSNPIPSPPQSPVQLGTSTASKSLNPRQRHTPQAASTSTDLVVPTSPALAPAPKRPSREILSTSPILPGSFPSTHLPSDAGTDDMSKTVSPMLCPDLSRETPLGMMAAEKSEKREGFVSSLARANAKKYGNGGFGSRNGNVMNDSVSTFASANSSENGSMSANTTGMGAKGKSRWPFSHSR